MQVQLTRLFGAQAKIANSLPHTPVQWRHTLTAVLKELAAYLQENVDTDSVHESMIAASMWAARESLKADDFWPGYAEAITRITLLLIGDYPDHRRRKPGRKGKDHYRLDRQRTVGWTQTPQQRQYTLHAASRVGLPTLSGDTLDRLREFRSIYGYSEPVRSFVDWYRATYPVDYSAVFR